MEEMNMKQNFEYQSCREGLETVVLQLQKLNHMLDSLCLGMKQENLESQAIDCLESVGYCVNDIKNTAVEILKETVRN